MNWLEDVTGKKITSINELLSSEDWETVRKKIDDGIKRANDQAISNVAKVKKWTLISKEFSVDGGELGPTLKMKRFHIAEQYKKDILDMYNK